MSEARRAQVHEMNIGFPHALLPIFGRYRMDRRRRQSGHGVTVAGSAPMALRPYPLLVRPRSRAARAPNLIEIGRLMSVPRCQRQRRPPKRYQKGSLGR
jgi:hypothetical protein